MTKITPFLWFDNNAEAAIELYSLVFPGAEIISEKRMGDEAHPSFLAKIRLINQEFMLLNAGPTFKPTPSVSFVVQTESVEEIRRIWEGLSADGQVLMDLAPYPFADLFGWTNDRFGVSWQLMRSEGPTAITPALMYSGQNYGKADQAIELYTSTFPDSGIENVMRQPAGTPAEGKVAMAAFHLAGSPFFAMENDAPHPFTFTEGTSFFVECQDQAEVDRYWDQLIANGGEPSQCGWLKDPFGVSWQIIPEALLRLQDETSTEANARVFAAMLTMSKIDIAALEAAATVE